VRRYAGQIKMDQDVHAQHYEAECECIMEERIRPWLRMIHSITPGANILVICSHLESPPQPIEDVAAWSQHVQLLAGCVHSKVHAQPTLPI
jgi:hypothetical protein